MDIIIIAAISTNGVIGNRGGLPWHSAADMRHFKKITSNHPFLVGRKTFESFPQRPLPGRLNIVLTRNPKYTVPKGAKIASTFEAAVALCAMQGASKMFILGGAQIYRMALPQIDKMVITHLPIEAVGDTHFPKWDPDDWQIVERQQQDELCFVTYRRLEI